MPAVKITQKPIGTPGDDTHFIVTQPELPEGYTPTGQETEEELEELKVESVREIEMDAMVALIQEKLDMDETPTTGSSKPVTSGGIKAALDLMDDDISSLNEDLTDLQETSDKKAAAIYETASGEIASFSDGADDMPLKSCVVSIEPIQEGTGDPSPDNVRPISGRTGVSVVRTGRNLLNLVESEMISTGWDRLFPISLKAGTYIISCQNQFGASVKGARVSLTDENDSTVVVDLSSDYIFGDITFIGSTVNITEAQADKIKNIRFALRAGGTTYNDIAQGNIQLELGSSATDYEPYKGNTYSVNWETEAGTVYGGTLDVVSGKLTVDSAYIASYNGETLPSTWISDRDVYAEGTTPTTGAQVVYKLAEPVEYQLTPQEVRTLLGENNIWSDGGDVTAEYPADTKTYIDTKIAEAVAAAMA